MRKSRRVIPGAMQLTVSTLIVAGSPSPAHAIQGPPAEPARDPISAQRPGNQGTDPVEPGVFQVEFGYSFERDRDQGTERLTHTVPELLLILGVSDRADLRLWGTGFVREQTTGSPTDPESVNGMGDVSIGSLVPLVEEKGWLPAISILPSITLPTGTAQMTAGEIQPGLILASSWATTDRINITWNGTWRSVVIPISEGRVRRSVLESVLDLELRLTEKHSAWVEHVTEYSTEPQTGIVQGAAAGISYRVTDSANVDALTAIGLSGPATDFMVGIGASVNWRLFR